VTAAGRAIALCTHIPEIVNIQAKRTCLRFIQWDESLASWLAQINTPSLLYGPVAYVTEDPKSEQPSRSAVTDGDVSGISHCLCGNRHCTSSDDGDRGVEMEGLRGRVTAHHRFVLKLHLDHLDAVDAAIARIDKEVDRQIEPFRTAVERLCSIPGVSSLTAEVIVSEVGLDMSRFPTVGHFISWAGLCPKNDQSAGKRRSTRMRKGAPWLKTILIQCAWAATRVKGCYLQAQYLRLRSRRGAKKAVGAVAASILTAAYHMLRDGTTYQDLGAAHFDRRATTQQVGRLLKRLHHLGYDVQIAPVAA